MFRSHGFKPLLLYLKGFPRTPFQTPNPNLFPSTLSLKHFSLSSQQHSFTVSYLINNFGFSPETALKASKRVRFHTPRKPDSVIAFFTNNGFTKSQINNIVSKVPDVLTCDPYKRVLPKFQFLLSKGASNSDIIHLVSTCPRIIAVSLDNNITPTFELVRRFLHSDKKIIDCLRATRHFLDYNNTAHNVNMLVDVGVKDSNIAYVFRMRPTILLSRDLKKTVDEVKEMGFETSKYKFVIALIAKRAISESLWDTKVEAFKNWGWSEELVLDVFKKHPIVMLVSKDKINMVLRFWVDRLGLDPLPLAKMPKMFGFSLEKRIIPRGLVARHLISKGLREKSACLSSLFNVSEELFLENYVVRFEEERCQLLKLYQQKVSFETNGVDGAASGS